MAGSHKDSSRAGTDMLETTLATFITANHVLDHYGLVDGFGHISVRDPQNPSHFYMTGNTLAAFVSSASDLAHYSIEDGSPVKPDDEKSNTSPWSERFCHSEILKRYPDVQSVVHSHSVDVITFGVSCIEMTPMFHLAGFLGQRVPIFDIAYQKGEAENLLLNNSTRGAALASSLSSKESEGNREPDHAVTLQRGHGFTTWGSSIQEAVYRAFYTQENAKVQMNVTNFTSSSHQTRPDPTVLPLSDREIKHCSALARVSAGKAWAYWSRIVAANPMYRNDMRDLSKGTTYWKHGKDQLIDAS